MIVYLFSYCLGELIDDGGCGIIMKEENVLGKCTHWEGIFPDVKKKTLQVACLVRGFQRSICAHKDFPLYFIADCEGNVCGIEDNSDVERLLNDEDEDDDDILVLNEDDIPGASLDGKHPCELNIIQLKRWLVCRGAPVNGKKPELIQRYACSFCPNVRYT